RCVGASLSWHGPPALLAADPPDPVSAGRPRPTVCEHPRLTPFLIDRGFPSPTPLGSLTVLTRPPVLPLSTAVRGVWTREDGWAVDGGRRTVDGVKTRQSDPRRTGGPLPFHRPPSTVHRPPQKDTGGLCEGRR